jgi:hypothetical protein
MDFCVPKKLHDDSNSFYSEISGPIVYDFQDNYNNCTIIIWAKKPNKQSKID